MNIIAFAGSNSTESINKRLVNYTIQLTNLDVNLIDFNDFNIPTYSIDIEKKDGFPIDVVRFFDLINSAEILIIGFTEHNACFTAVFKSYMDWCSRKNPKFLSDKKIFAVSTSPGGYGGKNSLEAGSKLVTKFGAEIIENFSLPKFNENFADDKIINSELDLELKNKVKNFISQISQIS